MSTPLNFGLRPSLVFEAGMLDQILMSASMELNEPPRIIV
jgi:hypothetical protein